MDSVAEIIDKSSKKTYKHFSLATAPARPAAEKRRLEFFYVGKKTDNIDLLIRSFASGYAAESTENASFILSRLVDQNNTIPDVIIAEGSLGLEAISAFHRKIASSKSLQRTPFILDGSNLSVAELEQFKHCVFIDEIVFLRQYSKDGLSSKINFLKKVKQRAGMDASSVEISMAGLRIGHCLYKRTFDIIVSSLLLIIGSPLFLLIGLAIKLESRGPVFYVAKRAGRGYRIFNFYKFRTMFMGADKKMKDFSHLNQYLEHVPEESPVFVKFNNDPRITRVGAFLRKLSLDELPQLFNVLKGDMSLVGNRPLPLYEAAALTTDEWAKRFLAPAGITGLWQIKKKRNEDISAEERILLDCDYADKSTFMYDLWIMAQTPSALMQKPNA